MKRALLTLSALLLATAALHAQSVEPWRLSWKNRDPQIHTYRNPAGELTNYWYLTFEISNDSETIIPILLDVQLYTESGKDLQHDVQKVDSKPVKEVEGNPRKAEELRFGRFYANVVVPVDIEHRIIEYDARLGNRSPGIITESIENLKKGDAQGNRRYLNPREMRAVRAINPGQTLHGIAIYGGVDPHARVVEVHVSGLVDILRYEPISELESRLTYENKVLRIRYDFKGDEYDREADALLPTGKDWIVRKIGPIASKETLSELIDALLAGYRREKEWTDAGKTSGEIDQLRSQHHVNLNDYHTMARVIRLATDVNFRYDDEKTLMENEQAIWRLHEWWTTNASKLQFDAVLNRFVVKDEKLPGTVDTDK